MAERKIEEEKKSDGGQEFLTETAMKLVELSGEQAVFEFIGIRVREIVGDAYVVANIYHPESEESEIIGVYGPPRSLLKKAAGLLGRDPVGMRFPIKGKDKEEMLEDRLRTGPKGIHDLTAGAMPESVASALDKLLGVGKIYGMGFVSGGELFGNITIICRKGNPAFDETTVETVTRMGALVIKKEHGEGRFRAMVEKGCDIIILVDRKSNIFYVSPSFKRVFGKEPEGVLNTPINEFFANHIHPEDLDDALEAYGKSLGKPGNECRAEFRFKHADGTWHYLVAVKINHLETPSVNGLVINLRDITAHKKASETLAESEEKYRTLVESMQEGLWVTDENANTSFMNSSMARMLGYSVEEMLGKSMFDFMDEQDLALAHNNMARRRMGIRESHEFEFLKKDGSRIYVQMATSPLMGKGGEYKGAIAGVQNITERRRLEVELKRHNDSLLATTNAISEELAQVHLSMKKSERLAVLGQMAASVSHELRNPLSVINNIAYYLRTKIPDTDDKTLKMLEILEKEVERSDRIIGNMLTFSRRKPNLAETVNIKLLIKAYFADPDRVPGKIKLKLNLEDGMPTMVADEGKLIQVLDNLVTNAFHAMPGGGTLTVSTKATKDSVEFSVRDTGHGMDADTMVQIFEPMFSTKTTGFGLGLPIVKTMVDDHDGNVTVASEPGVGTEFKVVLPRDGGAEK